MGWMQEVYGLVKDVMTLTAKQEASEKLLSKLADKVDNHDSRLVRMETIVEVAKVQQKQLQADN